MDTLIIQVDFNGRAKPYQLGIEVVPPDARASNQQLQQQQRQQQATSKARYDPLHEYQNFDQLTPSYQKQPSQKGHQSDSNPNDQSILSPRPSSNSSPTTVSSPSKKSLISARNQSGLLITKIYKCSVIDQNGQFKVGDIIIEVNGVNFQARTFQEAQKILKTFVEQPSHGPLFLTVLRKAASSSSLPSTTGSQSTVIERSEPKNKSHTISLSSSTSSKKLSSNSTSTPSPRSSSSARHLGGALNTRRIGTIYSIKLKKSNDGGFGIKIAERDNMFGSNRPIYITAITTTGSAYRDGRLREGDMLLEVNGIDISGTSQPEVTKMLKGVSVNETVEFVVSRLENDQEQNLLLREFNGNATVVENKNDVKQSRNACDNNESLIDLDVPDQEDSVFSDNHQFEKKIDSILNVPTTDGPGIYIYDIPLNDTKSAGLGLYLKCPTLNRKDLGIWIEKVITGGAAWKDGRLLPDDQILAINGINLMGLSNVKAYETLTAAVCRGIGPEATTNTIRLNIHRRDPSVVAKILQGTNNRIEHSDLPANGHNKSNSTVDKTFNNTTDSYQTALDNTIHSRSQSSNDTSGGSSNKSSNQNSQNDSAMSPQTQASNSIKLSNIGNDRSDHNSSDQTNDTSSAISQITDFTTVPITSDTTPEKDSNNQPNSENHQAAAFTLPKTLEVGDAVNEVDPSSSIQSWDEESIDNTNTGEERFQRDGFGRRSISEKRHAQLMAKNTDTYKRNQKIREERERQRLINEQLERMRLDDLNKRYSLNITGNINNQRISNPMHMAHDSHSIYGSKQDRPNQNGNPHQSNHREVPVDVHLPAVEHHVTDVTRHNIKHHSHHLHQDQIANFEDLHRISNHHIPNYDQQQRNRQLMMMNQCVMCGSMGACLCQVPGNVQQVPKFYTSEPVFDGGMLKRSNSLESIQQHHSHYMHENQQIRKGLIVPRSGTVRVARNRKINESFRAAVDRSYDGSTNDSGRSEHANNENRSDLSSKMVNSITNSTTSTSNDEKHLLNGINNNNSINASSQHKKSSSLLTKFLKLGSMKKSKKKNKDLQMDSRNMMDNNNKLTKETLNCENIRSQASKSSQLRTNATQSHSSSSNQQQYQQHQPMAMQMKTDNINGQAQYEHSRIKQQQPMQPQQLHSQNSIELHHNHPLRASLNMLQYQQFQQQAQQNHHPHLSHTLTHPKLGANLSARPTILHNTNHINHYSGHNSGPPPIPLTNHSQQMHQHQFPTVELQTHHQLHQYQATGNRNHLMQNLNVPNGCNPPPVSNQWQPPPVQTPNGLWVANATISEPQIHHQQQLQHNSLYGSHNHSVTQMHSSQPTVTLSNHHHQNLQNPFIPQTTAGNNNCQQNLAGVVHRRQQQQHQSPILQGQVPTITQQQHLHNQQPQHIYYYDF